ncbi:MAG: hypothetical protein ABSH34_13965 [Verrucomicrobiota bacterium]
MRDNPFPHQPSLNPESDDPRVNGTIYCEDLHVDKTGEFYRLLIPTSQHPQAPAIAFLMDQASRKGRGIGKSAFLKHQQRELMKDLGDAASHGAAVLAALYVVPAPTPPSRKFWEFCRLVLRTMLDQNLISIAICRVRALSGLIPEPVLTEAASAQDLQSTIGSTQWLHDRGVSAGDLSEWARQRLVSGGVPPDWAMLLAYEGHDSSRLRKQWFANLHDAAWKTDGGNLLFDTLVKVFQAADFTKGLLLVDEVEKIVMPQNLLERRAFADALRFYLIDGNCQNARSQFYGLLLTIHPLIQELLLPYWQAAGLDRLAPLNEPDARQCTLYFPQLTEQKAVPLVKVYLDYFRSPGNEQSGIQPFTEEAVVAALMKSNGLPGRTLNLLHRVVERAAGRSLPQIDKQLVEEVASAAEPGSDQEPEQQVPLPAVKVRLVE